MEIMLLEVFCEEDFGQELQQILLCDQDKL